MKGYLTKEALDYWLKVTAWDKLYWSDVNGLAIQLKADGCTGVVDYLAWTCMEHDIHYRTHGMVYGHPLTKEEADYIFRVRIQQGSSFGRLSPISWIRWIGVRVFGSKAWEHENT